MTTDQRIIDERKQLEADLQARGVIKLSLTDEIKKTEDYLREYSKEQERDPVEEQKTAEEQRFKAVTLKLAEDILWLSRQAPFRRFCWKLFEEAGMFQVSFRRGDPYESALREGRRSVGLDLMAMLTTVDPMIFVRMQNEHVSDIKSQQENKS